MAFSFWEYRSFFFVEIFTSLYYANEKSDDVKGGSFCFFCVVPVLMPSLKNTTLIFLDIF